MIETGLIKGFITWREISILVAENGGDDTKCQTQVDTSSSASIQCDYSFTRMIPV